MYFGVAKSAPFHYQLRIFVIYVWEMTFFMAFIHISLSINGVEQLSLYFSDYSVFLLYELYM